MVGGTAFLHALLPLPLPTPHYLLPTPYPQYYSRSMDPLSDLLRVVRLDGAFFYSVEAVAPWSVETVAARELTPRIMPSAEHLISYHIVTDGRCYGGLRR